MNEPDHATSGSRSLAHPPGVPLPHSPTSPTPAMEPVYVFDDDGYGGGAPPPVPPIPPPPPCRSDLYLDWSGSPLRPNGPAASAIRAGLADRLLRREEAETWRILGLAPAPGLEGGGGGGGVGAGTNDAATLAQRRRERERKRVDHLRGLAPPPPNGSALALLSAWCRSDLAAVGRGESPPPSSGSASSSSVPPSSSSTRRPHLPPRPRDVRDAMCGPNCLSADALAVEALQHTGGGCGCLDLPPPFTYSPRPPEVPEVPHLPDTCGNDGSYDDDPADHLGLCRLGSGRILCLDPLLGGAFCPPGVAEGRTCPLGGWGHGGGGGRGEGAAPDFLQEFTCPRRRYDAVEVPLRGPGGECGGTGTGGLGGGSGGGGSGGGGGGRGGGAGTAAVATVALGLLLVLGLA